MRKIFLFICMLGLFASLLGNRSGLSNSWSGFTGQAKPLKVGDLTILNFQPSTFNQKRHSLKENSPYADDPSFLGTLASFNTSGTLYTWRVNVTGVYAGPISPGSQVTVQYDTGWGCSPDYDANIPVGADVSVYGFYYSGDVRLCQSGSSIVYHIRDVSACMPPPGTPQLASPADNGTITDTTPTFTWNVTSSATKYELWLSTASDFSAQLNKYTSDSASYTLTKALTDGVYYWRVRGRHIVGSCILNGPFSATRSFTIGGPVCDPPGAPALAAPADSSTTSDNTPTFSWSTVSNATDYELQVDNNSDFSSPVLSPTPSGSSYTPSTSLADGTYYWRVRGHNGSPGCNVDGPWSSMRTVTIKTCSTPGAPGLSGPANGSTTNDNTPTFSWNTVSNATDYELQVDNNSDFSSPVFNPTLAGSSYTSSSSLANGTYYWRVRGHNASSGCDVYGPWSSMWSLTVNTNTCGEPGAPALSAPSNGSATTDTTPTFSWNTTSYATEYQLQVDNNSDFSSPVLNPTLPGTSYTPATSLAYGTYYWRVRGHNAGAGCDVYGPWSSGWSLVLNTVPTVEPSPPPVVTETSTPPPDTTPTPIPPQFVYVPMNLILNRAGFWEQEDNGDYLSANGPVPSGQTAFGYLNDQKDYFYFIANKAGPITINLDHLSGQKVQLQLFYQMADPGHLKTYLSKPPYQLSYWGDPGRYYIYIATVSGFDNSVPYTLALSYP